MGTPSTRIRGADFLTPPEFRGWRLAASEAGRVGGVRLELVPRGSGTGLGACYQQVPLRALPPFPFGAGSPSLVYLLNPTAGLMDGDAQLVEVTARPGARAVVAGQSATRVHPCLHGFATQQWRLHVAAGAVLVVLPGPAIPFCGSRYYQRVAVDLDAGASFAWGDVWLAGRYGRGAASEWFQFEALAQELVVRRQGRLVYRDRFCWRGPWGRDAAAWHFGGSPACGSLFVTGPINQEPSSRPAGPEWALFPTAWGDTCVRACGPAEAITGGIAEVALQLGSQWSGGGPGGAALLDGNLAPVHWFSRGHAGNSGPRFSGPLP